MTHQNLVSCLNMTLTNYNKDCDDSITMLWSGLFGKLDFDVFQEACFRVMRENKFFPNTRELLDAYTHVKNEARREMVAARKNRLLTDGQYDCCLCGNSGGCFYERDGYEFYARCVCARGSDLNRFREEQVDRNSKPDIGGENFSRQYPGSNGDRERNAIRKGRNPYYLPNIGEALGDDFELYKSRLMERRVSGRQMSDAAKARKLREMQNAMDTGDGDHTLPYT